MQTINGTSGNDIMSATSGGVYALQGHDTLNVTAQGGTGQIHTYGGWGNDWTNLSFNNINIYSFGHHAYGGNLNGTAAGGNETFNFQNLSEVNNVIVGRIDDFDYSRDRILIEGVQLNFSNLPSNVRVVEYNGQHNDPGSGPQQWLLIDTGGGHVFYALNGARVDMNGDGGRIGNNDQETHFITSAPNFSTLQDVQFIDQIDYVPAGFTPSGGLTIQDTDKDATDVLAPIVGSASGDLIAAGLNNDIVNAGGGNDRVWGGSGNDTLYGVDGDDILYGGTGDDFIFGQDGNDTIDGSFGTDTLAGQNGNDVISGGSSSDLISGNAGNDFINGGFGHDRLNGGSGADRFFHLGIADHGSDWVQDYSSGAGDILHFGQAGASINQFQVNFTSSGSGNTAVDEAFVIYTPTGQIMWALVDGAGQSSIDIQLGGTTYDLL